MHSKLHHRGSVAHVHRALRHRFDRKPRGGSWSFAAVLVLAALASTALAAQPDAGYRGRPLTEALVDLQNRGLPLFFTSNVVRPHMRVATEPEDGALRAVLTSLLTPHGLTFEPGPGGRLVIIEAGPSRIRGLVRDRRSTRPIEGVRVLVPETGIDAVTDKDGTFEVHDLGAGSFALEAHRPGYVIQRLEMIELGPHTTAEVTIDLEATVLALDEIVVTPSRISMLSEDPVTGFDLDRDDIFTLPHLGDDIFRALTLLPGVSGEEVSARFNVRGGRSDEVKVMLDRLELFEPYHLKDFSSQISIITPQALAEVDLTTGGFPVEYGDRMSGVLDMRTAFPSERRRTFFGLSIVNAEVGTSGIFGEGRGTWLGSARRGGLDLTLDLLGQEQKPRFWDAYGKLTYSFRPENSLSAHVLAADDSLTTFVVDPDTIEDYDTSYGNRYGWLNHQAILSAKLFVDSTFSVGRIDRDRIAFETDLELDEPDDGEDDERDEGDEGDGDEGDGDGEDGDGEDPDEPVRAPGFDITDRRQLDVASVRQDWSFAASDRHHWKWGFGLRRLETDFDYTSRRQLDDPLALIRAEPRTGTRRLLRTYRSDHRYAYLGDRLRLTDALMLELGLRWDEQTEPDDSYLSPRFNLVWTVGKASTLRAAWGHFYQSQRPYELQVADGVTELARAERTEHRVLGFEHAFAQAFRGNDLLLRVEAYQRLVSDPRPRFENIYEPISIFPEIEGDRVQFAPERSEAWGLELFVRSKLGQRIDWFVSYTYARVKDQIDGRDVPRRIDQPHAFALDVNLRAGAHWNVNLAWRYHTGWPITGLSIRRAPDEDGEEVVIPVFGPLNAERLPDYHRLDLRASRTWQRKHGTLGFFVEIQNVYDRQNLAGYDADFNFEELEDGEDVVFRRSDKIWGRILPSFGITWQF